MSDIRIALDAMSGDHGPKVIVPAALSCVEQFPELSLVLVGNEVQLRELLHVYKKRYVNVQKQISLKAASQVVRMDEPPGQALKNKKDSSMRVAINMVKNAEVHGCVSAGNTGALMAIARFVLKMIPGIDRPAICSALPAMQGHTHVMDLGANVDCSSEHLYQFAMMGSVLVSAIDNIEKPRVGLLNIGEEDIKGNEVVKQTSKMLAESGLNYIGYVEGNDIYGSAADVVITDGFVGNAALKSSEGIVRLFGSFLKESFERNLFTRIAGLIALPVLKSFRKRLDPRSYNGATLLGLQGIVIKSHGSADEIAFANAIKIAMLEVKKDVVSHISRNFNLN